MEKRPSPASSFPSRLETADWPQNSMIDGSKDKFGRSSGHLDLEVGEAKLVGRFLHRSLQLEALRHGDQKTITHGISSGDWIWTITIGGLVGGCVYRKVASAIRRIQSPPTLSELQKRDPFFRS